ncbi:SNF2-related protein [Rubritalea spongiae]|uniref:SNF2-related protein n=1 Tax=Rubritalea spongiae TaxID=430797 RepID=A0ABW5E020_9BACT
MKIDEKWIRKVAGWKAMKAGKEIYARGVVTKAQQNEGLINGEISGGGKPTRVTVRVHSDTDIDTVCPKLACRRTGEICAHAVAVMLGVIHGAAEKKEKSVVEDSGPQRVPSNILTAEVLLPPVFPKGLPEGGLSLRLMERETEAVAGDLKLAQWLEVFAGGKIAPMLGLKGKQALEFLKCLDGHPAVLAGEEKVNIGMSGVRVPMHVGLEDDRVELSVCPSVQEHGALWYTDGDLWLWDVDQRVLVAIDVSEVLNERQWLRIAAGNAVFVPMKSFLKEMAAWQKFALWDDGSVLERIPVKEGAPEFVLELEGSTEKLRAKLQARYTRGVELTLGLFGAESVHFPVEDPAREGQWIERNRDAEDEAAGLLMRYGFQIFGTSGHWELGGDDAVIDFLTDALPELENLWEVKTGGKLRSIKGNLVRVRPNMQVQGSGEDWLAFDYGFQTDGGKDIPREAIQKMLASGRRTATTKNGKQVVMSKFDAEMVETVLRDTDPRQEGGKFYVAKNQGAYLRRIRDYYQGESAAVPDRKVLDRLSKRITSALRGYQEEGIAWLYERCERENAALLADDMGLGKTLQTLSVLQLRQVAGKPSLVVCPTSLLGNWADEAEKWTADLKVQVMHGPQRKEHFAKLAQYDLIITSYALVARDLSEYQSFELNMLVLDEASIIRNPDTQSAKALRKLTASARVALSGTPVENAVRDLWSLYAFLLPGYLGSREDFKNRYEVALSGAQIDANVLRRLRMRVEPFMIRRTKSEVAKDLPKKLEQVVWCEPSQLQKKAYEEILRQGVSKVDELDGGRARMQMLTVLLRLRQASCDLRLLGNEQINENTLAELSAKLEMLLDLLKEAKRGGHRVLVFSQFTKMLGIIRETLEQEELSYSYLDGSTRDRAGEVRKFQDANGPDVFLISLKAGGYGLNLTAADMVVHFDPWWNPAVEAQATDRAYRIGQTKPVSVYKLITRGTVEEKILKLQEKKRGLIGAAIGDESQPMMSGLSEADMRDLLT